MDERQAACSDPKPASAEAGVANFNGLAAVYRWMEYATFGPWLTRCRCAFLSALETRCDAVILGDGDGRFSSRLLRVNRRIQVTAVDASSAMLDSLRKRTQRDAERVSVHCTDARRWRPGPAQYDLIVTHFFLDCLTTAEIRQLAENLRPCLRPDALWLISEFAVPRGWLGRSIGRLIVATLYQAFGLLTGLRVNRLPDHASALESEGFERTERRTWLGGLLVSELWRFVRVERISEPISSPLRSMA
jgi:hypothetical protein